LRAGLFRYALCSLRHAGLVSADPLFAEGLSAIEALLERLFLGRAGVDAFVAVGEGGEAARAFLRRGIHGFEMNLEPEFLVRLDGFCETRVICCETLFPPVFSKFFFAGHP